MMATLTLSPNLSTNFMTSFFSSLPFSTVLELMKMGDLVLALELDVRIPGIDSSSSIYVDNLCLVTGSTILAPTTLGFSFPLYWGASGCKSGTCLTC